MKTALISGISGQDGSYLAKLLLEKGYNVCGTSRDAQMSTFNNLYRLDIRDKIKLDSMSLTDFRSVLQILTKYQPDEVYNLAGQSSVGLSFQQPVETLESIATGTLNLLEAIRFTGAKIKLYNASSSECFGDTGGQPATEITPFRPRSPYAVAKSTAFWEVANYREAYNLFACSGILFNHESPLRPQRFVTQKIISVVCKIANGSNEKLHLGNISVQRDWGWAPEYVEAMYLMLQQEEPDDYVIATGESYPLQDFVIEAFATVGLNWQNYVEVDRSLYRPTDISVGRANPIKAKEKLAWKAQYKMPDVVRMMVEARMANI
ncbi:MULTISPECIES: GDP-mannose 4,6-dehydratase [Okeania]|uniref:GDP-mannose 4,6-dehydratase n=1 Tax=Okeania hirsuta TaxID=1458930 RepID=A0A3N6P0Q4_9CYAN|nr:MULTISPECIES: GDP-mannose 4,6-dehydratase [Okeania]NEP03548.1 GDP-mannose 4,6-dehydratase [Okeania sp. SIO4D6]NEP74374.1 GDP-mannose 4,6-dehydratase [Okeania sp. SIO2G5]NEP95431.1 GDP-mannose 4,6-dehydratase [Okeania sp. SIO2F5]NEQ93143.1 GDP-mannose 4,6-dehydratase [Okeania sp. SIO2G4]RQH26224.1 GDP-mannose 4,6-dehydratase [Okeania hirsuta]